MTEREYKIAISTYPFFDNRIRLDNAVDILEMNEKKGNKNGAIIYIHIPFCDSICDFCIYNKIKTNSEIMEEYTQKLVAEIELYAETNYVQRTHILAIYFGGGTPSTLSETQLHRIINACWKNFNINLKTEITLEVNPQSVDRKKMACLKEFGINRISAGIQTFNDKHRNNLGLKLNSTEILKWIEEAASFDFNTLSIDLMFGLPEQTLQEWSDDLKLSILLPIQHISTYELCPFPNTRLGKQIASGHLKECSISDRFSMFLVTQDILLQNSFHRQIVPEFYLKNHSCSYWDHVFNAYIDTIALGVSSFGFINGRSYQNETTINTYMNKILQKKLSVKYVSAKSTEQEMAERDIVFSLRKGCIDKAVFQNRNHHNAIAAFRSTLHQHIDEGLLVEDDNCYHLSLEGLYRQEDVAVSYMKSSFERRSKAYEKMVLSTQQLYHE